MPIRTYHGVCNAMDSDGQCVSMDYVDDATGAHIVPTGLEQYKHDLIAAKLSVAAQDGDAYATQQYGDNSDAQIIGALQAAGRAPAGDVESVIAYLNSSGWKPEAHYDNSFWGSGFGDLVTFFGVVAGANVVGPSIGNAIANATGGVGLTPDVPPSVIESAGGATSGSSSEITFAGGAESSGGAASSISESATLDASGATQFAGGAESAGGAVSSGLIEDVPPSLLDNLPNLPTGALKALQAGKSLLPVLGLTAAASGGAKPAGAAPGGSGFTYNANLPKPDFWATVKPFILPAAVVGILLAR